MRKLGVVSLSLSLFAATVAVSAQTAAQNPPAQNPPPQAPAGAARQGGGGRGRAAMQVMSLTTTAWRDGGEIPVKFSQAGVEVSPALSWSGAPDTTMSYVLLAHDLDAAAGDGTTDVLHWMLWNIPKTSTGLPEGVPQGAELADGTRQISVTGPNYRGPAAPASGPAHHYVFEMYALDAMIDVKPVGATVVETRAAVMAAMAGHVRAKAAMTGTFRRATPS